MSKLLGQGGYGCVYWPEIMCSGKIGSNKLISKIQKKNWAAKNEFKVGESVRKIQNYSVRFVPAISSCEIKLKTVDKDIIKDCDVIKKSSDRFVSMKFPYLKHVDFNIFFSETSKKLYYAVEHYKYLVRSLELLSNKGIIHHDLKMDNIIINHLHRPIIIDFGISINKKMIKKDLDNYFYIYAPEYYPWCFEIHLLNFIVQIREKNDLIHPMTKKELIRIVDEYVEQSSFFQLFSFEFNKQYKKSLYHYIQDYIHKTNDEIINLLLKTFKTWDLVAVSILFIKTLNLIYKENLPKTKFIGGFVEIILMNMNPYPEKRLTHKNTIKRLNALRKNTAGDLYNSQMSINVE
tara:strand:+ start:8041 stop:9084 length:1044 start_codon:yes stop_codon:yes gene_type:complete